MAGELFCIGTSFCLSSEYCRVGTPLNILLQVFLPKKSGQNAKNVLARLRHVNFILAFIYLLTSSPFYQQNAQSAASLATQIFALATLYCSVLYGMVW